MIRLHVVVRGRVQGVGFRFFILEMARRLDLAGWVRNRADGSVEVAAEGDDGSIETLRRVLRRGPDGAVVQSVDDVVQTGEALPRPFTILR